MTNVRDSIKGQYLGGLKMLRQTIEVCPDDVWTSGKHPRNFWRIVYHVLFYTDLYMSPTLDDYKTWSKEREDCRTLWEEPPVEDPYTKTEMLEYTDKLVSEVSDRVDLLDLEKNETGFWWYKNMSKLDHQLMNLRHLQGHVGQLSELLMAHGIDIDWVGIGRSEA